MSGHNKWSKIKNKKAVTDGQKSKIFGKMVRLLTIEAQKANGVMTAPGLVNAIAKAREVNMPNDNIERAIKKASTESADMETINYESYGPGGVAIIIEALTSNKNKAAQEIKFILSQHGSELASIGSATWAFEKTPDGWKPNTETPISDEDGEKLSSLIEALEENDEVQSVYTNAQ